MVLIPKLDKNYAGRYRHLIIVLYGINRHKQIENIRETIRKVANKKSIEVTILTIEEFQDYLNVDEDVRNKIKLVLDLMISTITGQPRAFDALINLSDKAKEKLSKLFSDGMGINQFYYNKYKEKIQN